MGKTLRNLCIASTNDFPGDKNDKIKGWIEHNGGIFSKDMSANVTHLLASQKAWKRYHPLGELSIACFLASSDVVWTNSVVCCPLLFEQADGLIAIVGPKYIFMPLPISAFYRSMRYRSCAPIDLSCIVQARRYGCAASCMYLFITPLITDL